MEIKIDNDGTQRAVCDLRFIHVDDQPAPKNTKLLLYTKYGTIIIGHYNDEIEGWLGLPRKPKRKTNEN